MASSLERTSSSGSVPIQRNEENIQVLLPDATAPAWEEVLTGVKQGTIPTVLIELGLIFINGARVLPRDIPAWLGHEATDIPSEAENEDKTVEEAKSWTEIVLEDDATVAITVPFNTSVCCKEVFISHPALDKHMSVAHNDTFRRYKCALCTKTFARYKQAAVHHGFCKKKNSREKVVARAEDAQKGTIDNPIEILNPFEDLATEETEEADLVQGQTKVAKKTGLSQHERYRHPNLRNAKRVAGKQNDIERKRLAREKTREQAEETEGTLKPKRTRWSEAETKMLIQLEVELQGSKQINIAIAGILESKTAKQISYKRSMLSKAKQPKGQTPPLDAEPVPIPEPLSVPLVEMLKEAICVDGGENVDMSAELLTRAIEGESVDELQDKLLDIIKTACSKPTKKQNGPVDIPHNPRSDREKKREEYRRIQRLYYKKRKELATEILDCKPAAAKCDLDPKTVHATYQARFGGESQEVNLSRYPKAKPADNELLMKPITQDEIQKAYSRAKKDSAAGPDGIGLRKLKELDPKFAMTCNIYNVWLHTRKVPNQIKDNRSILLPKGTKDLEDVNNWRPLTISSVMLRLYTNILAKRVTKGVPLNPRQRGFIEAPGCSENGFLLQRIQKHAKRNRKRLSVVFLDLAKAFDTVSHKHISEGLKRFRVNSHFIDAVVDLYTDASTHFTLAKGETPKIPMTRGVKQGDPLSPLLFNVAMDPLLEAISAQNNGYKWDESGLQLEALCYADDNGLLTEDPKEMQSNLDVVNEFCEATGMRLNVKKSAGYDIQPSANRSYIINDFQPK